MTDYDELLDKGMEEAEDLGDGERFEVPVADTRKEGSKTIIPNFSDIASKFGREEKHLSKYIQNELGTAGHIEGDELILNGEFRRGSIQAKIQQYAEEYVFCPECSRPDTKIVKEKGVEMLKCQACGARTPI
ncbi:MAG: translation initiation factor IF-2 subunit beta [Nanohaloarchaea archaeon QH_8_44_6]|nr:MAG: translation initiation factor IF-2 subunit beta [Nanohaloarchaea archaeon QH_8_44_6]